jgi:hypothetical protein
MLFACRFGRQSCRSYLLGYGYSRPDQIYAASTIFASNSVEESA